VDQLSQGWDVNIERTGPYKFAVVRGERIIEHEKYSVSGFLITAINGDEDAFKKIMSINDRLRDVAIDLDRVYMEGRKSYFEGFFQHEIKRFFEKGNMGGCLDKAEQEAYLAAFFKRKRKFLKNIPDDLTEKIRLATELIREEFVKEPSFQEISTYLLGIDQSSSEEGSYTASYHAPDPVGIIFMMNKIGDDADPSKSSYIYDGYRFSNGDDKLNIIFSNSAMIIDIKDRRTIIDGMLEELKKPEGVPGDPDSIILLHHVFTTDPSKKKHNATLVLDLMGIQGFPTWHSDSDGNIVVKKLVAIRLSRWLKAKRNENVDIDRPVTSKVPDIPPRAAESVTKKVETKPRTAAKEPVDRDLVLKALHIIEHGNWSDRESVEEKWSDSQLVVRIAQQLAIKKNIDVEGLLKDAYDLLGQGTKITRSSFGDKKNVEVVELAVLMGISSKNGVVELEKVFSLLTQEATQLFRTERMAFNTAWEKAIVVLREEFINPGGIDLNTSNGMLWKVSKDGRGVEMNIDPAMIERIRHEGIDNLSPVILKMTPLTSIWPLIGLHAPVS
jgi:hypothetical protein